LIACTSGSRFIVIDRYRLEAVIICLLWSIIAIKGKYMPVWNDLVFKTPIELQTILGEQIQALRLSKNLDQRSTAEKAGISEKALRNLEAGRGSTVETLLRTLKALDSLEGLRMLAPDATVSPLALLRHAKVRQRVRRSRKASQ
jgi:DNA-binding XRE family transcriptional regulator